LAAIVFFFKYKEKITKWDLLGSVIILASSSLIGFGFIKSAGDQDVDGDANQDMNNAKNVVIMGCFSGIIMTINTLNMRFIIKDIEFPTEQMIFDGNLVKSIILLPLFITYTAIG
jgi:hypothetical protein